jgi:hypothetical protein
MERYDPEVAPDPIEWLALDADERTLLVEQYHRDARVRLPEQARPIHALIHTVVENQLALENQTIVRETLQRLTGEGLTRHDAVHAIGSVLAEYIHDLMNKKEVQSDGHLPYYEGLHQLTADKWRGG